MQASPQSCSNRPFLKSTLDPQNTKESERRRLRLALLGCETNEPYGPIHHTGELFMSLFEQASSGNIRIHIDLFNAKEQDYPDNWDLYDGIVIPGSFSAAYDSNSWILKLRDFIQKEVVGKQIPTLGICFGHQVLAHSFATGLAISTPSGARGGRYTMETQHSWTSDASHPNLYFTHGDMVAKLPETAVCLGGDDLIPIQAAAYFTTVAEKEAWMNEGTIKETQPFAVTFQAHPEYATSMERGVERTLCGCLRAQASRGAIANEDEAIKDSKETFENVRIDSVRLMSTVMTMLGWQ